MATVTSEFLNALLLGWVLGSVALDAQFWRLCTKLACVCVSLACVHGFFVGNIWAVLGQDCVFYVAMCFVLRVFPKISLHSVRGLRTLLG